MENIVVEKIGFSLKNRLVRIGDISFFEGPIISLFEDFYNNDLYFYDWVDRDSDSNRWLIYKVNAQDLLKFLNRKISHFNLFQNVDTFFVADIDNKQGFNNYSINKLLEIPTVYIPNEDSFFEQEDCPFFSKILSFVSRNLLSTKQENEYSYISVIMSSFLSFPVETARKNQIEVQDIYSYYNQGSFIVETNFGIEAMPENQFDLDEMYDVFKDRKPLLSKIENVYA